MYWLAPAMLLCMMSSIFIGIPVSFTLIFLALTFGYAGLGQPVFDLTYIQLMSSFKDEVMISIPLFIFMGYMSERAGLVEKLFISLKKLLAPIPGSLYYVIIVTAVLLSMATGVVGASVTILAVMAVPSMMRLGYDQKISAGVIAGGGSLVCIPPAVPLLVMAPTLGVNINDLYAASFGPGFLAALLMMLWIALKLYRNPSLGPVIPVKDREAITWRMIKDTLLSVVPLALLIVATLGSMLMGWATSTEASACGAAGAMILSMIYKKFSWSAMKQALDNTTNTAAVVMLLAIAGNIFGSVFTSLGGDHLISNFLINLDFSPTVTLIVILLACHLLGWPFEWPVIILVFLPIFLPTLIALNVDLIWFGALLGLVIQTAYMTPPVAMTGYYVKQAVPQWDLKMIFKAMLPFMWLQVLAVVIVFIWPSIATWFPKYLAQNQKHTIKNQINHSIKEQELDILGSMKSK